MTGPQRKLWRGILILALLAPLGIILPKKFGAGGAWGEWGPEKLERLIGYTPEGFRKIAGLWKAPVSGYAFGGEGADMTARVISYIASGLIGILATGIVVYLIARVIVKNGK